MHISTSNRFSAKGEKPEAYFLGVLWDGLEHLNAEMLKLERAEMETNNAFFDAHGGRPLAYGSSSCGNGPNDTYITNLFVWYASSAISFLILFSHAFDKGDAWESDFAALLKWRNKVSAHPAHAKARKDDSAESKAMSIAMTPDWDNDHYSIGGWIIGSGSSSSHADWHWALTPVHRQLEAYIATELAK